MENITNTTKYTKAIQIVLIVAAFSIAMPLVAKADWYWSDIAQTWYQTGDSSSNNNSVDENNVGSFTYGENNTGSYVYDTNANSGSYVYDTGTNNYSNNYSYTGYYPTYYGNSGSNWVSSGGFIQGPTNLTAPTVYNVTGNSIVESASFSSGASYSYPSTYYYPQSYTVSSGGPTYYQTPVQNQVLAYTDTNPNVSSVYLSDVPYTGLSDYYPVLIFVSILVSFSAILSYIFLKRKIAAEQAFVNAYVNTTEVKSNQKDSINSELMNQIASDNSDINMISEYARKNKILLSTDATIKLVKLGRAGQLNVSEYIKNISTGDWQAIGEKQIQ
jgi:hypothetical protein